MPAMSNPSSRLADALRSYRAVAHNSSYSPLLAAQLLSTLGDTLHYIALVVLVFELTGQGLAVAILVVAEIIPVLILGPVAGVIIDRFSRKHVLIGADLIRAGLALSLVWPQGAWHAYLVAAGLAAGSTFFNPTVRPCCRPWFRTTSASRPTRCPGPWGDSCKSWELPLQAV